MPTKEQFQALQAKKQAVADTLAAHNAAIADHKAEQDIFASDLPVGPTTILRLAGTPPIPVADHYVKAPDNTLTVTEGVNLLDFRG